MAEGYGPKSETPSRPVKLLAEGRERILKVLKTGFPGVLASVPAPVWKLEMVVLGVYRGIP